MKTVEEIQTWIVDRMKNLPHAPVARNELQELLQFIGSERPCQHIKGIGSMRHPSAGWMPFRAYVDHEWKSSEVVFDKFKFCPYCGEKLNV